MGVVTGKGLAELVRENYGIRWSAFATLAVLIANFGICISDFVGVGAALGLAGVPAQVSVPIAAVVIWLIIVRGSYRSGRARVHLADDPVLRLPGRGDPRPP